MPLWQIYARIFPTIRLRLVQVARKRLVGAGFNRRHAEYDLQRRTDRDIEERPDDGCCRPRKGDDHL